MIMQNRLYQELAWLWPMWGEPGEYGIYCDFLRKCCEKYSEREILTLLNVGCGGGKNIFHLKPHFTVTGLDISPDMLKLAHDLNPECRLMAGDMRNFALEETYDAVLIDDGVSYMVSEVELQSVFDRVFFHLNPGGVMFCSPDETKETFVQNKTRVTTVKKPENSLDLVFIENDYDTNVMDTEFEGAIIYLIREQGKLRIEKDIHRFGLFSHDTWQKLLLEAGFKVNEEVFIDNDRKQICFICTKPL